MSVCLSVPAGHESPAGSRCVISEFIRPLQISADKPEQLSVKPTLLAKARAATPRCRFDPDVSPEFYTEKLIWDEILGSCTAGIPWAYLRIITGNICMCLCSTITEKWEHSLLFEMKSILARRLREAELTARSRRSTRQI